MVNLITALSIQANGAEIGVYETKEGKYGFEIYSIIRNNNIVYYSLVIVNY